VLPRRLADLVDERLLDPAEDRLEDRRLVPEVMIERTLRHAGTAHDVVHRGTREPLRGERDGRGVEERGARGLAVLLPTWPFPGCLDWHLRPWVYLILVVCYMPSKWRTP